MLGPRAESYLLFEALIQRTSNDNRWLVAQPKLEAPKTRRHTRASAPTSIPSGLRGYRVGSAHSLCSRQATFSRSHLPVG